MRQVGLLYDFIFAFSKLNGFTGFEAPAAFTKLFQNSLTDVCLLVDLRKGTCLIWILYQKCGNRLTSWLHRCDTKGEKIYLVLLQWLRLRNGLNCMFNVYCFNICIHLSGEHFGGKCCSDNLIWRKDKFGAHINEKYAKRCFCFPEKEIL